MIVLLVTCCRQRLVQQRIIIPAIKSSTKPFKDSANCQNNIEISESIKNDRKDLGD